MFPFDFNNLPTLKTRRALLAIDLQNDFVSPEGSMPALFPLALVESIVELADSFRRAGDTVCWVSTEKAVARVPATGLSPSRSVAPAVSPDASSADCSSYESSSDGGDVPASIEPYHPLPSPLDPLDVPGALVDESCGHKGPSRGGEHGQDQGLCSTTEDNRRPDGNKTTGLALESAWGCALHPNVLKAADDHNVDLHITKSYHSAFRGTDLLARLRRSFVTELFLCGSLINTGVFATAIDASAHGYSITIVEPCCGYRDRGRRDRALRRLIKVTGCNVVNKRALKKLNSTGKISLPSLSTASTQTQYQPERPKDRLQSAGSEPSQRLSMPPPSSPNPQRYSWPNLSHDMRNLILDPNENLNDAPPARDSSNQPEADQDDHQSANQSSLCEGDTTILLDILPEPLSSESFDKLHTEVKWIHMSHQGGEVPRLVAVQGDVALDGSVPIYRHPADASPPLLPFSPLVLVLKGYVEHHLGHPLNHVLMQYYRTGNDFISEHSDKTLDIVPGSFVANLSLGAERTMIFRTKIYDKDRSRNKTRSVQTTAASPPRQDDAAIEPRRTIRVQLPHNSLCRLGLRTNMRWLHAIRQDKRLDREKTSAEIGRPFSGGRISLTFRHIGTFLSADQSLIWGQGATAKTRDSAQAVQNGLGPEAVRLLHAFSTENHSSDFDWAVHYGAGFDVLHLAVAPRFFAGPDRIVNLRIALMLAELDIGYARGSLGQALHPPAQTPELPQPPSPLAAAVRFCDADPARSVVSGELAIMLYLDATYTKPPAAHHAQLARQLSGFQLGLNLLSAWCALPSSAAGRDLAAPAVADLLAALDALACDADCLAGPAPSLADYATWPALHVLVSDAGSEQALGRFPSLAGYYNRFASRKSVKKALGSHDEA